MDGYSGFCMQALRITFSGCMNSWCRIDGWLMKGVWVIYKGLVDDLWNFRQDSWITSARLMVDDLAKVYGWFMNDLCRSCGWLAQNTSGNATYNLAMSKGLLCKNIRQVTDLRQSTVPRAMTHVQNWSLFPWTRVSGWSVDYRSWLVALTHPKILLNQPMIPKIIRFIVTNDH